MGEKTHDPLKPVPQLAIGNIFKNDNNRREGNKPENNITDNYQQMANQSRNEKIIDFKPVPSLHLLGFLFKTIPLQWRRAFNRSEKTFNVV